MILTCVPYDDGADLGRAYNEVMRRLGDDDWACFLDHDAMFTTRTWHAQLLAAVERYPEAGLFGVCTNRVGNALQEVPGVDRRNHDVAYHRKVGREIAEGTFPGWDRPEYLDVDHPGYDWLAGVAMFTSKRAWSALRYPDPKDGPGVGFPEGYFLGLDNHYHREQRRLGRKCYLLTRVYVYHWYRAFGDDEHVQGLADKHIYRP